MKGIYVVVTTFVLFVICFVPNTFAQPVGIFESHADVIHAEMEGSASYDPQTGVYEVIGTGESDSDGINGDFGHYVYSEISGDFRLKVKVESQGPRAGWVVCLDDVSDSPVAFYSAWVEAENTIKTDRINVIAPGWREQEGIQYSFSNSSEWVRQDEHDGRVEIVREGNTFSLYYYDVIAEDWLLLDIRDIEVTDPIVVGLSSWSGDYTQYNTTYYSEVEFIVSEEEIFSIWEDYVSAHNTEDLERLSSHWSEDINFQQIPTDMNVDGKEALSDFIANTYHAFSNWQFNPQKTFVSDNILVSEVTISGNLENDFGDLTANGLPFQSTFIFILEFNGTKIVKAIEYFDYMPILQQLGYMPVSELPPLVPSFELPAPEPTGLTSVEAVEELISRFNTHDLANWSKMVHPDIESTIASFPGNREEYTALLEIYFMGFSDLLGDITRSIDLGDGWVLTEIVYKGTNDGPYLIYPPSSNYSEIKSAMLQHFDEDGLLTYINLTMDNITLLENIGALQDTSNIEVWDLYE